MTKEIKSADELKQILDERLKPMALSGGAQWIKIVAVDPPKDGVNWRASHSGEPGAFADAIERVMPDLQKRYDLAS